MQCKGCYRKQKLKNPPPCTSTDKAHDILKTGVITLKTGKTRITSGRESKQIRKNRITTLGIIGIIVNENHENKDIV